MQGLSDAEHEIMKLVWQKDPQPALFAELMEGMEDAGHPCQKNTLITLLGRLMRKGYLRATKMGHKNLYSALVSAEEFQKTQARGFLEKYYGGSAPGLVSMLLRSDMLTPEEYNELRSHLPEEDAK